MDREIEDWSQLDELLFQERRIAFLMLYRELTGISLPYSVDALVEREAHLRAQHPQRFLAAKVPGPVEEKSVLNMNGLLGLAGSTERFSRWASAPK